MALTDKGRPRRRAAGGGGGRDAQAAEIARLRAELAAAQRRTAELERLADEDPLVPLLNRRGFLRELERALAFSRRYGARAALVFMDLDGFKAINDAHGHAAGDAALRAVADILHANLRRSDVIGRLGGDEFAVLLWSADADAAARKARALAAAIEQARPGAAAGGLRLSVSWGVTAIGGEDTADGALARADRAMYAAKRAKGLPAAVRR